MKDSQHFRWGLLALDSAKNSAKTILPVLPSSLQVVDFEVMPQFDGRPDEVFVWFICATERAKALFADEVMADASRRLREEMARRGFPESALDTLNTGVTSQEDIADGGGCFYYFR